MGDLVESRKITPEKGWDSMQFITLTTEKEIKTEWDWKWQLLESIASGGGSDTQGNNGTP